jgi:thiol:disulfide interchange protein DsbD
LFILGIYFSLSLPFHVLEGVDPDIFNQIATNFWLNMVLGVVFIIFAISFFGAFELTLPSSWINKADKASDVGGIVGIFFMAITLVLVSFTCTGPILGGLLGATLSSAGGEAANMLSVGMLGFGLAFGLPFGLFAFFPGWLNSLPKSGGWLNTVKVVFGFLELAFAFKFLSNADLVMQTGILKREIFIAIWIAVFLMLSLYLFKLIRFEHDDDDTKMSIPRALIGALTLTFTIYLVPGLWGAPLKIISGFPPPNFYSEAPGGFGGSAVTTAAPTLNKDGNIVGDPEHCPHGLSCFHDYEEGMAYAKESGKPVLLDFTGWACVNCRKMEEQVWSDPRVLDRLSNEYVLISLYVDEKAELPKEEQIEVKIGEKTRKLRTVGNRWSYFQANRFGNNSQPYYVVLDHEENQLGDPASYDPDIEKYVNWLDAGISAFEAGN